MTRFKKCIKKFIKDWKFMDFVCLALLAVLMVASYLIVVVGIIIMNVHASNRGALPVMIAIDAVVLLVAGFCIDGWLDERDRKKRGLPRHIEPEFPGFHQ